MALHFKNTYITEYGYQLISRAIAGCSEPDAKLIEWGVARTSSVDLRNQTASDIVGLGWSDFANELTSEGAVTKAAYNTPTGSGAHNITLSCELMNTNNPKTDTEHGGGYGDAYTLIICAKLKDDSTSNVALIATVSNTSTLDVEHIPQKSVSPWSSDVSFMIDLRDNQIAGTTISMPDGYFTPVKDFSDLAGRVVTTHSEDSEDSGDSQTVYGDKTFKNKIIVDSSGTLESNGTVTFNTDYVTTHKVAPAGNKVHDLGASNHRWKTVYSDKGDFSDKVTASTLEVTGTSTLTGTVNTGALTASSIKSNSALTVEGQSTFNGASTFNDNVTIKSGKTITGDLNGNATSATNDSSGRAIASTYVTLAGPDTETITGEKIFDSGKLVVKSGNGSGLSIKNTNTSANLSFNTYCNYSNYNDFSLNTGLQWKGNTTLKAFTTKWVMSNSNNNATITSITTTPPETNKWSLGTSQNKLKEVHAANFRGTADSAGTATSVGITGTSSSASYPLVFTSEVNQNSTAVYKSLFTDTYNSIYYNPSTDTLTCSNISFGSVKSSSTATYDTKLTSYNSDTTNYINGISCTGNFIPSDTNTYNLGSSSLRWNNIYGTKIYGGNIYVPNGNNLYVNGYTNGNGIRFGDTATSVSYPMIVGESWSTTQTALRENYYVNSTLKGTIQTLCDSNGDIVTTTKVGTGSTTTEKWSIGTEDSRLKELHTNSVDCDKINFVPDRDLSDYAARISTSYDDRAERQVLSFAIYPDTCHMSIRIEGDDGNDCYCNPQPTNQWYLGSWENMWKGVYTKYLHADSIHANNMNDYIDSRISELFSTTTPINAERLVYIDAFNDSTTFYDAFADVGTQTNAYGQLDLEYRYRYGTSIVGIGEYLSGKQLRLTNGSSATGTWEVMHALSLPVTTTTGLRRYFIAKRIA